MRADRFRLARLLAAFALGALTLALDPSAWAQQSGRWLSIQDIVAAETIGRAVADPASGRIVYERSVHRHRPDFSVETGYIDLTAGALMLIEPGQPARALVPEHPTDQYAVIAFSPKGDRLSYYRISGAETALCVVQVRLGATPACYGPPPDFRTIDGSPPQWIDDTYILYPALPPGTGPWRLTGRRALHAALTKAREKSWRGREPSFRIAGSADVTEARALPGTLVLLDLGTGREEVIAEGRFVSVLLSPDHERVAALREYETSSLEQGPVSDLADRRLVIIDLARHAQIAVDQNLLPVADTLAWSPDSSGLAFLALGESRSHTDLALHVADAASGKVRGIDLGSYRIAEDSNYDAPRPVWNGLGLLVGALRPGSGAYVVKVGDGGSVAPIAGPYKNLDATPIAVLDRSAFVLADDALWEISAGKPVNLSQGRFGPLSRAHDRSDFVRWKRLSDGRTVALAGGSRGQPEYAIFDPRTRSLTPSWKPADGAASVVGAFPALGGFLVLEPGGDGWELTLAGERATHIETLNRHVEGLRRPIVQPISYTNSVDGTTLTSCLYLPGGVLKPDTPIVVNVYPSRPNPPCKDGPAPLRPAGMSVPPSLFMREGYAYLDVALPEKLHRGATGPLENAHLLVMDAVARAKEVASIPRARIVIWGSSQGGFTALSLATQLPNLAAVVAQHSWADPMRFYFDDSSLIDADRFDMPLLRPNARHESASSYWFLGGPPWKAAAGYIRNSPLLNAEKISAPVFMTNTDMDAFDEGQFQAMLMVFRRMGKPACLTTYFGEGHGLSSPANFEHSLTSTFAWLRRTLDGQPNRCETPPPGQVAP